MSDAHEQMEQAETAKEASREDKRIALVIAILALFLSFSETLGKGAQTEGDQRRRRVGESVVVLPGQDRTHDHGAHRRRSARP